MSRKKAINAPVETLGYLLPKLKDVESNNLPKDESFQWQAVNSPNDLDMVQSIMAVDTQADECSHSIPDILMHSLNFEKQLFKGNNEQKKAALDNWLGTLAGIAFARDEDSMRMDINLIGAEGDQSKPYFLRAVSRSLVGRGLPIAKITLYMMKQKSVAVDYTPVAFSYPGMKTYIAPAAETSEDLLNKPKWFNYGSYKDTTMKPPNDRNRGEFASPMPYLLQSANIAKRCALYDGLTALQRICAIAGALICTAYSREPCFPNCSLRTASLF
jgi:hypothetical protein